MRLVRVLAALAALLFTGTAIMIATISDPPERVLPRPSPSSAPATTTTTEPPATTTSEAPTTTGAVVTSPPTTRFLAPPTAAPTTASLPPVLVGGFIGAMNRDRAANGLAPLAPHGLLTAFAQSAAQRIAALGALVHSDLVGIGVSSGLNREFRALGENIAYASATFTVDQFEALWMASPAHRANILGAFTHAGIGEAMDGQGRRFVAVWFGGP